VSVFSFPARLEGALDSVPVAFVDDCGGLAMGVDDVELGCFAWAGTTLGPAGSSETNHLPPSFSSFSSSLLLATIQMAKPI
jgi:hypothetical protein